MSSLPASPVAQPAGNIALFGMVPGGRRLAEQSSYPGVAVTTTLQELNELALVSTEDYRRLHSIVIVACPGDDLSVTGQIYTLATNLHILVTAILIHDTGSTGDNSDFTLQRVSDIIVHSPDAGCIDDILGTMAA